MNRFKLHLITILLILSGVNLINAQNIILSDSAVVSLITCSPGPQVYAKFGHTAIRLIEPTLGMDIVFNYGMFNFNKPNFYMKFIKGETDYELGVYETKYFLPEYQDRNSSVTEQVLNLTKEEKQKLVDALFVNYEPQNREYRYNFVFDNCSTRPRDKILSVINDKVGYRSAGEQQTYRNRIGFYTGENTWTKFGIDMLLGKDADVKSTRWTSMFLPEVLSREFGAVEIVAADGTKRPLIKSEALLVERKDENVSSGILQQPLIVTLAILLIGVIIILAEYRQKKYCKIVDSVLLIVTGLAGIIVFYLMFFSVHPLVQSNYNILWCNPLNVIVGILLWNKKLHTFINYFQLANVFLFFGALLVFVLSIQAINVASIPLIVLMLTRSLNWIAKQSKKLKSL
ncbi:MAG TPA: DUF4105 domain-containing protein [Paludibacteraceae bacterium]|nr:DUF4105 domain-containing protein [Paludibacteraceae bacterium]HPT43095.1 DUF4105 domain-containing protein [Paludibacteraceae bacterium]